MRTVKTGCGEKSASERFTTVGASNGAPWGSPLGVLYWTARFGPVVAVHLPVCCSGFIRSFGAVDHWGDGDALNNDRKQYEDLSHCRHQVTQAYRNGHGQ